jgi:predicted house-cleaning noncanonical NTP pyrophosphatase (MazG superfamily)
MEIGSFKVWYTLEEAARVAAAKLGELITVSDILDKINYDELPAWFDATGRYARYVYPACHYDPDPNESPLARRGFVDYRCDDDVQVMGLMGYYKIYNGPGSGIVIFVPIDETMAEARWNGGLLLIDHDGGSLVQVVRRKPEANKGSRFWFDFVADHTKAPRDKIWIAAEDLHALISEHANASAVPLALPLDLRTCSTMESISLSNTLEGARELRQRMRISVLPESYKGPEASVVALLCSAGKDFERVLALIPEDEVLRCFSLYTGEGKSEAARGLMRFIPIDGSNQSTVEMSEDYVPSFIQGEFRGVRIDSATDQSGTVQKFYETSKDVGLTYWQVRRGWCYYLAGLNLLIAEQSVLEGRFHDAMRHTAAALKQIGAASVRSIDEIEEIASQRAKSSVAKKGGDKTNEENRKYKEAIFAWCRDNLAQYEQDKNLDGAADEMERIKLVPLDWRTIRTHITGYRKQKKQPAGAL